GPAPLRLQRRRVDLEDGARPYVIALADEIRAPVLRHAHDMGERTLALRERPAGLDLPRAEVDAREPVGRLERHEQRALARERGHERLRVERDGLVGIEPLRGTIVDADVLALEVREDDLSLVRA